MEEKFWPASLANCTIKGWRITQGQFIREKWFENYGKCLIDEEIIKFIWNHIQTPICPRDSRECWSWKNKMNILGKEFESVCNCEPVGITNPSGIELEHSKKLILIIKAYLTDFTSANKA